MTNLGCHHGGLFWEAVGPQFDNLSRMACVVNADVLDAWFPPASSALAKLAEAQAWMAQTSPPTHAEGLVWVDEAYIDYLGDGITVEPLVREFP